MMYTKNRNSEARRLRGAVLALVAGLGFAGGLASCSQIVDSDNQPKTENNVKQFYYKIEDSGAQYHYALTSKNAYLPTSDVLVMNMQGKSSDKWNGMDVDVCNWAYEQTSGSTPWFYAMSADSIVALGVEYNGTYTDHWVELKAPLKDSASWQFQSQGENITATITKYGVSAAVNGQTFNNVLVVQYKGEKGTVGTTWFQRDVGVIYSDLVRPQTDEQIHLQFKSMKDN